MNPFAVFGIAAVGTWLLRIGFIVLIAAGRLPQQIRDGFEHLAPSVLAAIVAIGLTATATGGAGLVSILETFGAAVVVGLIAWRTKNLALAAGVAMVAVLVFDVVL